MKFVSTLFYGAFLASGVSGKKLTANQVEGDIKKSNLRKTLKDLEKIASKNNGNRAFGLPGFEASRDYILDIVQKKYGKYLDTYVQPFNHTFEQTREISLRGPDGEDVIVVTLMYNTATSAEGATGKLVNVPIDDERGSGCFEDQWADVDATGKIALVKRGECAVADKLKLAKSKGAQAVVLINNAPGDDISGATLSAENIDLIVPVGVTTLEVGTEWFERVEKGEDLEVTLLVDSIVETRESWNVISETKQGDPNNVVMLGGHLDSVQAGAGINDDGSGTAGVLEIAKSFIKYKGFKNKVRFAWWGAEESGLVGSLYYGEHLSEEEADKIRFYFNYDMIGSPNPIYAVYADTDAHKVGGKILLDYLKKKGKDAYYGGFGSSSDYVAFLELGIPSSGLFTGAGNEGPNGEVTDPCYHKKCDDLNNVHWDALTVNTKAAGRAAAQFALSLDGVPPRTKTSVNPRSRKAVARGFNKWTQTARVVEKAQSCAHSGKVVV